MESFKKCGRFVYIKKPEFNELDYVSSLWADEKTMADVGGSIVFSDSRKPGWYKKMVDPTDGENFYCLIYDYEDNPVGEVSFHRYDEKTKTADFNVKIQYKYRSRGYGKDAIKLMLDYYFYDFGGEVMLDDVININGQQALLKFGFEVVSKTEECIYFKMTKEHYDNIMGNANK